MDVRMLCEKRCQRSRQKFHDRRDVGKHPDMATRAGRVPSDFLVELFRLV
jgi:hypothetical protein